MNGASGSLKLISDNDKNHRAVSHALFCLCSARRCIPGLARPKLGGSYNNKGRFVMDMYAFLVEHTVAIAKIIGVLLVLIAVWLLLNSEGFGRSLMRITVWCATSEKRTGRLEALRPGLSDLTRRCAPFVVLRDSRDGFSLTLSNPNSQTNPIWLWEVRWIGDHPFAGPAYEVEAIANPEHIRMVRDKGVYQSAQWAVRAVASHLAQCARNEPGVIAISNERYAGSNGGEAC
jgi:hypothetical protein